MFAYNTHVENLPLLQPNLNSIRYAVDAVLIADIERKFQELLRNLVKKTRRKARRKDETSFLRRKHFNLWEFFLTEDGKCNNEIRRCVRLRKMPSEI